MKAPDKLYLGRRSYGPLIGGWQTNLFESKEIESIAYIRKSALLEWAKERYQQTISNVGCYTGHSVWAEVIDKLNNF